MSKNISEKNNWFVYLIATDQQSLYTGITTNLERRFQQHLDVANGVKKAKGARFFRSARPLEIVYSEIFNNRSSASRREMEIKALSHQQKRNLVTTSPIS